MFNWIASLFTTRVIKTRKVRVILSEEEKLYVRSQDENAIPRKDIAKRFNISQSYISNIVRSK